MRLSKYGVLGTLLTLVGFAVLTTSATASQAGSSAESLYIVQMLESPAVAYTGDIAGYAATKPARGEKIDPNSSKVAKYADLLKSRHDAAIAKVGGGQKIYDYTITYNGFAAKLTEAEAAALKKLANVVAVQENELVEVDTSSTPSFLGLDAPGGLWSQLGGPTGSKSVSGAGENIIIGVVDSGITPESKSFSDRDAAGELIYQPINTSDWHGRKCKAGEQFEGENCSHKLIGAQFFNAAWGGSAALEAERPWEFMSPRDYNGHGTHTSGTAGGNNGVAATGPAAAFGTVSGIAPRARIAAYKALWSTQDASTASGQTADLVAAIDQAVADGVDVINYSVSGSTTSFLHAAEVAFLFAADAGVFVSASAGNSGPATSTVAHGGPWLTTVAAGTHNRNGTGSVTLGNGTTYAGASVATAVGPAPLIDSVVAGKDVGPSATDIQLCVPDSLDPAKVNGKIVICLRGVIGRTEKSRAVAIAGGVGMVMYNDPDSSLNADFHFVPSVHVNKASGLAIKAYAAGAGATATINAATLTYADPAPFTASFSSRGPMLAGAGDLLKPDVIAPGQDILAAVAPPGNAGREFNLYSGTSMSAPHVAGLGALLKQKYPSWSTSAIKSALMTSGGDILDGPNTNPLVIFRQGAGHVRPNVAANPGLVFENGFNDWLAFLCGTTTGVSASTCTTLKNLGYSLDPSNLNVASIAIGDLAGIQTVKRKVTNVGGSTATYAVSTTGLSGINTVITPSVLTLGPGQTGTFTVTFTRTTAALGSYSTPSSGQMTWSDGTHNVRIPVVLRPVALAAPAEVTSNGANVSWSVTTGYNGTLSASVGGLVTPTQTAFTVAQDPDQTFDPAVTTGTYKRDVVVPNGEVLRAGIYEDAITPTGTDLDMYVYRGATLVGSSADGDSNEEVTVRNTTGAAATYSIYVHGWFTNGPSAAATLFDWIVGSVDAGNTTISGVGPASTGVSQTHTASFTGLAANTRYLGRVLYSDGTNEVGQTLLTVRTP